MTIGFSAPTGPRSSAVSAVRALSGNGRFSACGRPMQRAEARPRAPIIERVLEKTVKA